MMEKLRQSALTFLALFLCVTARADFFMTSQGTSPGVVEESAREKKLSVEKKKPETKKKKPRKRVAVIDRLSPTSAVVRVNGEAITKGEFAVWEQAFVKMFALGNGWNPNTVNEATEQFRKQNRMSVLRAMVKHTAIGQYAREKGIVVDDKGVVAQERYFLRQMKSPRVNFSDVVALFGEREGEVIRNIVRGDALTEAVLVSMTSNDLYHVTALEFTNRVEFVKKVNMEAEASNTVVRARALQAKKEILAGGNFADVTRKYADFAPEQGKEWETYLLDEFEGDDPLGQWLARSETGDISDPLDLDDGISIVGIKAKYKSGLSESNKPPVYAYDVVRCAFHSYEKQKDFGGDRKAIEEDMIELRRQVAMRELRERLITPAKIEFPHGENLFYPPEKKKAKKKTEPGKNAEPEKK